MEVPREGREKTEEPDRPADMGPNGGPSSLSVGPGCPTQTTLDRTGTRSAEVTPGPQAQRPTGETRTTEGLKTTQDTPLHS